MAGPVRTRRLFKFDVSSVRGEYELDFEDFAGRRTKLILTAEQMRELGERMQEVTSGAQRSPAPPADRNTSSA